MSSPPPRSYADWKAPKTDGGLLLWPDAPTLRTAPAQNNALLRSATTPILGVPLAEIRQETRAFLGHFSADAPLIATGHQAELHHPGVWIKNAVIDALAIVTSGRAMHLAVDTDAPKHLTFHYPLTTGDTYAAFAEPITDDPALSAAKWAGLLSAPTPAHITRLERLFHQHSATFDFPSPAGDVLASLRRLSLEETDLPKATTAAIHAFDWSLGLRYDMLLASPIWSARPFLLFFCHLLAHAGDYAAAYNAALADYRRQEDIRTPGRPMPDLETDITTGAVELPFWLDNLATGDRTRATAHLHNGSFSITVNNSSFIPSPASGWSAADELQAFLRKHNYRLAPRALTLTTFVRLFLADLFIHGIGGGRYDQVTDRTLETFFRIAPPSFAVATATLYHPWARDRARACLPCVREQGHRLAHRVATKEQHLAAIAAAPRHSHARKAAFLAMHAELAAARNDAPELAAWRTDLQASESAAAADKLLFDRELFYALQPRERLLQMVDRARALVNGG